MMVGTPAWSAIVPGVKLKFARSTLARTGLTAAAGATDTDAKSANAMSLCMIVS
jgi:hypothetical protein